MEDDSFQTLLSDIKQNLDFLPTRYRRVVMLRFGLYDTVPSTIDEIASVMGIDSKEASNVLSDAICILGNPVEKDNVVQGPWG